MTHHPHLHMIVPGGGLSFDRSKWISCKPGFFLPVRVLSTLFRRLMLEKLAAAHAAGKLQFFGEHAHLAAADVFAAFLAHRPRQGAARRTQAANGARRDDQGHRHGANPTIARHARAAAGA